MRILLLAALVSLCDCSSSIEPTRGHGCAGDGSRSPSAVNGRWAAIDGMQVLYLWGTRREMGYAEGALSCGRLTAVMRDYVLGTIVAGLGEDYQTLLDDTATMADLSEGDVDQLEGIVAGMRAHCDRADRTIDSPYLEATADGSREATYADLVVANTLADWACSSFGAWGPATTTGSLIFARNLDYAIDAGRTIQREQVVKVIESSEENGARYLSVGPVGIVGCITCMTSEGVSMAMHDAPGLAANPTRVVPRVLALRRALLATIGAGDPVAAAESILDRTQPYRGNNFHLAVPGARGPTAVVFEYDAYNNAENGFATRRSPGDAENGFATGTAMACTNHYRTRRSPTACSRYAALSAGLEAAQSTPLDASSAWSLIDAVAGDDTIHTVIYTADDRTLRVHVGDHRGQPATQSPASALALDALFAGLPD